MRKPAGVEAVPPEESTALLGNRNHDRLPESESGRPDTEDSNRSANMRSGISIQKFDSANLVLLIGAFLVNADSAILLALFRQVASEFDALESSSWIINSYMMGILVAQPLCGKISDIYGRKNTLLVAYAFYCAGGLVVGLGQSFGAILTGRAIAGVGSAIITTMISTLIVDLAPAADVALWRGFAYAVSLTGRATGPPLGGFISDVLDWRWALLFQVPINILSLLFVWFNTSFSTPNQSDSIPRSTALEKLRRIDVLGATAVAISNCSFLLFLDQVPRDLQVLKNPVAIVTLTTWLAFFVAFIFIEAFWAMEPILPLGLLSRRNVFAPYAVQFLATSAQVGLFSSVTLFSKITMHDSNTVAALRLSVITVGSISGGLLSGFIIKKTGEYQKLIMVFLAVSSLSFLAIFMRWRGPIGWDETLYGLPCGFGFGVSLSATFIGLMTGLERSNVAIATSGFYLSFNLGTVSGVSGPSILIMDYIKRTLQWQLADWPDKEKIIKDVTTNIHKVEELHGALRRIVEETYIHSFVRVWLFCLICITLAFISSLMIKHVQSEALIDSRPRHSANGRLGGIAARIRSMGFIGLINHLRLYGSDAHILSPGKAPMTRSRVYLLTHPRTASNLLTRILNLSDQSNVSSSERGAGYYFLEASSCASKGVRAKHVDLWTREEKYELYLHQQAAIDDLYKDLQEADQTGSMAFVKEHLYAMGDPRRMTEITCGFTQMSEPSWQFRGPSGTKLPATSGIVVPDELLKTFLPTFLIRNPALAFPSFCRNARDDTDAANVSSETLSPHDAAILAVCTYQWSRGVYDWFLENQTPDQHGFLKIQSPVILDADDIIGDPELVKQYAGLIGLDIKRLKFSWESKDVEWAMEDAMSRKMLATLAASTSVRKDKIGTSVNVDTEVAKWRSEFGPIFAEILEEKVRAAEADYQYLRARRFSGSGYSSGG